MSDYRSCCQIVAKPGFEQELRSGPSQRFYWSGPLSDEYPRRDSNPRYRLERATEVQLNIDEQH